MSELLESVKRAVHLITDIPVEELSENTELEDFNFDSLDLVEILMVIEEEFDVVVNDDLIDFDEAVTLGDLVKEIEKVKIDMRP